MSDLIERLRKPVAYGPVGAQKERNEAADEIERLQARVKSLEEGECRFHCRLRKDMWIAGFDVGTVSNYDDDRNKLYNQWRKNDDGNSCQ